MRWLIVFLLASLVLSSFAGWLKRIGLGRLPGDFEFTWRGRTFYLPLSSSLLLSFIAALIGAFI